MQGATEANFGIIDIDKVWEISNEIIPLVIIYPR